MNLDTTEEFHEETFKDVEASYELSLFLVKTKMWDHFAGKTIVKSWFLSGAGTVLGDRSQ